MSEDRISQLPDAILQQILSLIDTNEALQTTILSKRWKNLSLSISDLKFHLTRFADHRRVTLKNREAAQGFSDHRFSHFVSRFLSRRDAAATIRSFHLSFDTRIIKVYADAAFVEECVLYAVNHGIQSLHLQTRCRREFTLPAEFFASKTLRELELRKLGNVICLPEQLSLPHLKTFYLESSSFVKHADMYYSSTLKEPFSGFPELEKLTLLRCNVYQLVVKAPKLRFLEIVQENSYYSREGLEEIYAPLLTSFRYEGNFPFECSKVNIPMLEEVYFNIHMIKLLERNRTFFNEKWVLLKCFRMFGQFGNAKVVTLTLDTLKVLEINLRFVEQSPSPFPYMKCLRLMKGRREIPRVLERVMKYLTEGNLYLELLRVEIPQGVAVVEKSLEDLFEDDSDELQLQLLFGIDDETSSS